MSVCGLGPIGSILHVNLIVGTQLYSSFGSNLSALCEESGLVVYKRHTPLFQHHYSHCRRVVLLCVCIYGVVVYWQNVASGHSEFCTFASHLPATCEGSRLVCTRGSFHSCNHRCRLSVCRRVSKAAVCVSVCGIGVYWQNPAWLAWCGHSKFESSASK